MRTAYHNLRSLADILNINNKNLNHLSLNKSLARNLLCLRKNSLTLTYLEHCVSCNRVNLINLCGNKFLILALEFLKHFSSFCLTNTLTDNMLCSLSNDSAELLCFKRNVDGLADLCTLANKLCLLESKVCIWVFNFLYNILCNIDLDSHLLGVDVAMNDVLAVIIMLSRNNDCSRNLIIKVFLGNAFFCRKHFYCFKKFLIHFFLSSFR